MFKEGGKKDRNNLPTNLLLYEWMDADVCKNFMEW